MQPKSNPSVVVDYGGLSLRRTSDISVLPSDSWGPDQPRSSHPAYIRQEADAQMQTFSNIRYATQSGSTASPLSRHPPSRHPVASHLASYTITSTPFPAVQTFVSQPPVHNLLEHGHKLAFLSMREAWQAWQVSRCMVWPFILATDTKPDGGIWEA